MDELSEELERPAARPGRIRRIILLLFVGGLVALFFLFDLQHYLTLDYLKQVHGSTLSTVELQPVSSALVFFSLYVLVTGLSLPGAAVMTLAAGALFGLFEGVALVSFASTLGASIAMLISRTLLRDWV
ncbi:MAG: pyridine nucleotide-disulfide oxidoreductase, partial [Gammaproteobacteria bacterium]|nr:pyridine nucleotide-disulfide oxidoreductase [Gammaproteobacteria bacterium]